jgi:hypothetical protein
MPAPKLTLVPYLLTWDSATRRLNLRILVAPTGNPLDPLLPAPPGLSAFADAELAFRTFISDAVGALPMRTNVDQTFDTPRRGAPDARTIFTAIKAGLAIPEGGGDTFAAQAPDPTRQLRKYLPRSYRQAFDFVEPRTSLGVIDDTYHCLMRCPPDTLTPEPPTEIGWGEAIAFALRRPRLAEALGLIVPVEVIVDPAPRLEDGGWLWVELAPASDYAAQAGLANFQRAFATRVPPLPAAATRPIFTPVLFPVSDDAVAAGALGHTDRVFAEALRFDDGFSKIVHARQPVGTDPLDEDGESPPPPRDEGVNIGFDDEDICEGQNRALGAPPDGQNNVVAPRGVLGYRIDVRAVPSGGPGPWISLSRVVSPLDLGVDLGIATEERWIEVHPNEIENELWLPAWFGVWRGGSMVTDTIEEQRLMQVPLPPAAPPDSDVPTDLGGIELRYGQRYDFRVRLADATGGGPELSAESVREGEAPIARLHMKRHVRPRRPLLTPNPLAADGSTDFVEVVRPPLAYPEAVFAAGAPARAALLALITANEADPANPAPPAIRDPDTPYLRIRVLLRAPTYDPDADEYGWIEWYRTSRPFPADPAASLTLTFDWQSAADYRNLDISVQLGADGMVTGPLRLVRSRDIRIEFRAIGRNDLSYFASEAARLGDADTLHFHASAAEEADALAKLPPAETLRSVLLRADPVGERAPVLARVAQNYPSAVLVDRLAVAADLVADGAMLLGRPGERVAMACAGLSHGAAPDASSLEFAEPGELAGQWLNVVQIVLNRDWTWRGQGSPTLSLKRRIVLDGAPGSMPTVTEVGEIELVNTINAQARRGPERRYSRFVFIDAFTPPLHGGLPYEVELSYAIQVSFEAGPGVSRSIETRLPVATSPRQVPKVRAAGIALTGYAPNETYSATASRVRKLWLEFDAPLADPRDAYFVRPLTRTPDPMLLPGWEPVADPEVLDPVPVDPELVRVITPGQVQDLSGLNAMQRLEPAANSDRHFLVPLPPNTDPNSPELFSFYTYEIRVGHGPGASDDPFWSTAQGRFGQAQTVEGVQHPAPELVCSVIPGAGRAITVRAPFATPYLGLRRVEPVQPNSKIWFVLYARIMQADATTFRNIQIDLRPSRRIPQGPSTLLSPQAETQWTDSEVRVALSRARLSDDTPLTVLAVELLPEPNGTFADPLGGDLGQVRVIRTSPLAEVVEDCCVP